MKADGKAESKANNSLYVIVCSTTDNETDEFMITKTSPNQVIETVTEISTGKHSSSGRAKVNRIFMVNNFGAVFFFNVQFVSGKLQLVLVGDDH